VHRLILELSADRARSPYPPQSVGSHRNSCLSVAMTLEFVSARDVIVNRLKGPLVDRIPSESQWCGDEEQHADKRNREATVRGFRTGAKLDGAGRPEPTSFSHHEGHQDTGKVLALLQDRLIPKPTAPNLREKH
jgi:hypothetical protein